MGFNEIRRENTRYRSAGDDSTRRQNSRRRYVRTKPPYGALILLAILIFLALVVFLGLDTFSVKKIVILGNERFDEAYIVGLTGVGIGNNIWSVDLEQIKENIHAEPLLQVKQISRKYPDQIHITVSERKGYAVVFYLSNYLILDENGIVIAAETNMPAGQYLFVSNVVVDGYELGQPLKIEDQKRMQIIVEAIRCLREADALSTVAELNLHNREALQFLSVEGIVVELGDDKDMPEKVRWMTGALPTLREKGYTDGTLYVSTGSGAVYSPKVTQQETPPSDEQPDDTDTPDEDP